MKSNTLIDSNLGRMRKNFDVATKKSGVVFQNRFFSDLFLNNFKKRKRYVFGLIQIKFKTDFHHI